METKISFFKNFKLESKTNLKKFSFWYKTFAMFFIFGVLFSSLIMGLVELTALRNNVDQWLTAHPGIINEPNFGDLFKNAFEGAKELKWISINPVNPTYIRADYGGYIVAHFTFFTVLSNFAIAFWFLFAILQPSKEGKSGYVGYRMTLILTTFITITMIIWLGLLMPTSLANGDKMNAIDWFYGLTEHLLFPLLFIGYVLLIFKVEGEVMDQKTYMKKEWKNIIFILLGYGAYCLIRGEIRYQGHQPSMYPYFFFNIHAAKVNGLPGPVWFVIALLLIAGISIGFSSGYNKLILKK